VSTQVEQRTARATKVIVATSVMLSFISFWRAAAIVLNDLGSSAYYVGGIAEQAVGRSAPWFILGVMLFSYAVRAVYVESCAMFTRGGVYRVVKEAMGGTLAKLSVSALMFDYILTGPISGVSAGQYIVGLVTQTSTYLGHPLDPSTDTVNLFAAGIAVLVTVYFWWRNTRGLHESSDDASQNRWRPSAASSSRSSSSSSFSPRSASTNEGGARRGTSKWTSFAFLLKRSSPTRRSRCDRVTPSASGFVQATRISKEFLLHTQRPIIIIMC
jgi:hypothetical protein